MAREEGTGGKKVGTVHKEDLVICNIFARLGGAGPLFGLCVFFLCFLRVPWLRIMPRDGLQISLETTACTRCMASLSVPAPASLAESVELALFVTGSRQVAEPVSVAILSS
jgi:hypothetical protein